MNLFELDRRHVIHPNHPVDAEVDFIVTRGEGVRLYDDQGRALLDGRSQLSCANLGYGHPRLVQAIREQVAELPYLSIFYQFSHPQVIRYAARLAACAPGDLDQVLFTSGGSEALEAALAVVRLYWQRMGRAKTKIISRYRGYHGATTAAMAATGMPMGGASSIQRLLPEHVLIAAPVSLHHSELTEQAQAQQAAEQLEQAIQNEGADSVAAFIAEPVIGVGGYIPPPAGYWPLVREICDRYAVVLVMDEVMTGFHRTGPRFAANHWSVAPDIMIVGKGINGCYVPCGGALFSRRIMNVLSGAKLSGFTHTGHPLAMAAANAALDAYEQDGIETNVCNVHSAVMTRLRGEFLDLPHVAAVEGLGLMLAMELADSHGKGLPDAALQEVVTGALKQGLIIRGRNARLAFCPPLIVSEADAMLMLDILYPLIRSLGS